jgi:hypothetical protein
MFLLPDCLEGAINIKFILFLFEQMYGLKINFDKSEVFCFGEANDVKNLYANIFTSPISNLHMKYLRVPIDSKKLNKCLCPPPTKEKVEKKHGLWKGRFLSLVGRLTLMNNVLTNVPLYMLSIYSAPKTVIRKIDIHRKKLFWQGVHDSKKFTWLTGI